MERSKWSESAAVKFALELAIGGTACPSAKPHDASPVGLREVKHASPSAATRQFEPEWTRRHERVNVPMVGSAAENPRDARLLFVHFARRSVHETLLPFWAETLAPFARDRKK